MKVLIAIVSCHSRPEYRVLQRGTWVSRVKNADCLFFLGAGNAEALEDEVHLPCGDGYSELPSKVQEIVRWAYDHDYDYVMKLDDDTIVNPEAWLKSGFEGYDFTGGTELTAAVNGVYTPYGFAYVLSRKAMALVKDAPLPMDNNDEYWVTRTLYRHSITLHVDHRYFMHTGARVDPVRGPKDRPLRNFNRPPEREFIAGTFVWCIYLNWFGWHTTSTKENLREYMRVWERVE